MEKKLSTYEKAMKNGDNPVGRIKSEETDNDMEFYENLGITKREYFAGLAMQALIAKFFDGENNDFITSRAVFLADDLLESLEKHTN